MLIGWLEFYVPFQHKYGYIRDECNPGKYGCSEVYENEKSRIWSDKVDWCAYRKQNHGYEQSRECIVAYFGDGLSRNSDQTVTSVVDGGPKN